LISKNTLCCRYGVFKVHAGRRPALHEKHRTTAVKRHWHGLSKLNSVRRSFVEVDVISRRTQSSDEDPEGSTSTNNCSRVGRLPG